MLAVVVAFQNCGKSSNTADSPSSANALNSSSLPTVVAGATCMIGGSDGTQNGINASSNDGVVALTPAQLQGSFQIMQSNLDAGTCANACRNALSVSNNAPNAVGGFSCVYILNSVSNAIFRRAAGGPNYPQNTPAEIASINAQPNPCGANAGYCAPLVAYSTSLSNALAAIAQYGN